MPQATQDLGPPVQEADRRARPRPGSDRRDRRGDGARLRSRFERLHSEVGDAPVARVPDVPGPLGRAAATVGAFRAGRAGLIAAADIVCLLSAFAATEALRARAGWVGPLTS